MHIAISSAKFVLCQLLDGYFTQKYHLSRVLALAQEQQHQIHKFDYVSKVFGVCFLGRLCTRSLIEMRSRANVE